ncbi:PTS sugar transporter subunit IIA [Jeotgalibacillus terrae]|uniref:PTS sugar transporter subunit IIA n=1 Tax=Jeotgalibacillus terrae TaxID=587735 RepID=A0ABW5ZLP1_9BACL|nr:PTS sugar transporter subunit IIA [Jeotgalibacillus terrae]MBM7578196.1 PTS system nitrogen regulatory IIA component [Jeotgalibacillus terrae]
MVGKNLFQSYFDSHFQTKEDVYEWIAEHTSQQRLTVIDQFEEREKAGSFLIAEHVVLPHIESEEVEESQIMMFRLAKPFDWDQESTDVQLIIALVLKKDEEIGTKKKISLFMRSLADEAFIDELLHAEETTFHQKIIQFQEERS